MDETSGISADKCWLICFLSLGARSSDRSLEVPVMAQHIPKSALFLLFWSAALPGFAQSTRPTVQQALEATTDLWGEEAIRQPNGPSYEFFESLLPPLRYVDCAFRHYPIALAAPRGANKARFVSNGSGVNLPHELKTKAWYDYPVGLEFDLGEKGELYGSELARLQGPTFMRGYLPIVKTTYSVGSATIEEEAFVPTEPPFSDHGVILVRFSTRSDGAIPLVAQIKTKDASAVASRLAFSEGWTLDESAQKLTSTLKRGTPLVVAVANAPLDAPLKVEDALYQQQRAACEGAWDAILAKGMDLYVPEERVNNAWKATIIANLMMATGNQMSYSAGNVYQRLYEAESGDALRSLLVYGFVDDAKQMVDPLLRYVQKGLGFHDAAFRLQMLAHVYWITRDAEFVKSRRELWRPSVDHILSSREKETGLLPKENYCGDIHTQVYSLNSNANCWRGLRDIAAVLRDIGETSEADQISASAKNFREKIQAALLKTIDPNTRPMFIPIALFGDEKPYAKITDTKMGSYWDLMIPYVLGSQILTDEQTQGALDYLHTRGGVCMGMIRFHQHSGLFANENGLDDLYTLRYTHTLLDRDEVDRAIVSFYGKLAQGMTRDTCVGGEGSSLVALDPNGRPMYLPPNSSGNGFFLDTLRNLLVQDHDSDSDGPPDSLRLLFATPRAWLADGKAIRFDRAPTAFGAISLLAKSDLSYGKVTVQITPPPRALKSMKLRVRLPDGWKPTDAWLGSIDLQVDRNGAVDVPTAGEPFTVDFAVSR
jgi:hypothetical protein